MRKISEQLGWSERKTAVLEVVAVTLLRAMERDEEVEDVNRRQLVALGLDMGGVYARIKNAWTLPGED